MGLTGFRHKGIAMKVQHGEQMLDIHLPTLINYLSQLPADRRGWHRFRCKPLPLDREAQYAPRDVPTSHAICFMPPAELIKPEHREMKITGPTEFKKAG